MTKSVEIRLLPKRTDELLKGLLEAAEWFGWAVDQAQLADVEKARKAYSEAREQFVRHLNRKGINK